ncbi:hypothetical protein [Nodularia spumigena]|uniref:hypothetical protein n=1 Tax=Nodularia spumigena TaxID=70799 RepID=UPI002B213D01|nr:hypothetical protein [Nodularia spumigena]MEA5557641.1 hypothetical protein [Nodularia spumigena CH309]
MPQRINLDTMTSAPKRQTIDATWSPAKKRAVAGACIGLGSLVLGVGGWYAWANRPVSLPTSRDEAIKVMASARYERMDEDRKRQYAVEAADLFKDVPREEMRSYFEDEGTRDVLMEMRREQMDETILRVARGEPVPDWSTGWRPGGMGGGRPGGGPGGAAGEGERRPWGQGGGPGEGGGGEMTDEQREQRRAEMAGRINQRIGQAINDGNAQMNGLRSEFMSRMRAQMGGGGGGGGRPPARGPG